MKVELEAPPGRFRFETAGVKLLQVTLGRSFAEAQQGRTIQVRFWNETQGLATGGSDPTSR